jgi:aryl-alcohol dehydrogenase-like predicted oxidoreductase
VPLDSGWLSGRYGKDASFTDVRSRWSRADIERRAALVGKFEALLPHGVAMATTALRWLLAQRCVSSVIPGVKSVAQLRDNLATGDAALSAETLGGINALWAREIEDSPLPW